MSEVLSAEDLGRLDTLFERGADLAPDEHGAFVARECGANRALARELERLLAGLVGEDVLSRIQPGKSLRAGTEIGRYKLLERVGQGGMGEVYAAEQLEPVVRRVALKIIKAGMDSAQVVARFHAERQALARMSHPHIAQVFDAGTTADGRPYFVMEFVAGDPLTEYCDRRKLAMRARLELFLLVCEGVQHAHQKGIIHRDLKPSNLLVMQQDGRALPKIIDFGVARATSGQLTERTLHTMLGQVVGTLDYMSPEQADPTSVDIDTRSDIYSLGVVLYQLVSGLLPFHHESSAGTPFSEVVRTIRETDPPTPSTRLKRQTGTATAIAALHGTDERALVRQLSGDLDWICLKALEKDPSRRYPSASELAQDLRRHLAHEPVLAGRPGVPYRARKFVRRNRVGVLAGLVVIGAGFAGIFGVVWGRIDAQASVLVAEALRPQADAHRFKQFILEADQLWPAYPSLIPTLEAWEERGRALILELPAFQLERENLRARAKPWDREQDLATHPRAATLRAAKAEIETRIQELERGQEEAAPAEKLAVIDARLHELESLEEEMGIRRSWDFDSDLDSARHRALSELIEELEGLTDEKTGLLGAEAVSAEHGWSIPKRLTTARRFEAEGGGARTAWTRALPEIRAWYSGLDLEPQMELLPLGPDPESGLWEFAHLQTGEPAVRGGDGKLVLEEESGLVFVLLPGGTFWMGAQGSDPNGPNYDPHCRDPNEGPPHEVLLSPFFLSKYEMTQGQWLRFTGMNPSYYATGALNPVEQVSYVDCIAVMDRLGLSLPTEAQWEYGARGDTRWTWWTGKEPGSLRGAVNLDEPHVPVNELQANAFGLYNVLGNVREWCLDSWDNRAFSRSSGTGDPLAPPEGPRRIVRGGGGRSGAGDVRSTSFWPVTLPTGVRDLGLRPARSITPTPSEARTDGDDPTTQALRRRLTEPWATGWRSPAAAEVAGAWNVQSWDPYAEGIGQLVLDEATSEGHIDWRYSSGSGRELVTWRYDALTRKVYLVGYEMLDPRGPIDKAMYQAELTDDARELRGTWGPGWQPDQQMGTWTAVR